MQFAAVQENLRQALWERIRHKRLTGVRLAEQTGFQQAHISNFLNGKRALSVEGFDRILEAQQISVLDLLDAEEVNRRASITPPSEGEFENVLVVDGRVAANEAQVTSHEVRDILKFKKSFLKRLRPALEPAPAMDTRRGREKAGAEDRTKWRRFVLIKVDGPTAMSMYPRLLPGATALIDRHYNTLGPYRRGEPNMYAVRREKDGGCTVKYVELAGQTLVLRPHNQAHAVEVVAIAQGKKYSDYIVGRVCHVAVEA